jgi:hypothetical protein
MRLSSLSLALSALPAGFFWLVGQHTGRLIALKTGIFAQSGILGKMDGGLIGRFLIVLFALDRRAQIDHFTRLLMH